MSASLEVIERASSHNEIRNGHSCCTNSVLLSMCFTTLIILNFVCCVLNVGYCAKTVHDLCPCRFDEPSDGDIPPATPPLCLSITFVCVFEIVYTTYFLLDFLILTCCRYPRIVAAGVITLEWVICLINQVWWPQPLWAFTLAIFFLLVRTILGIIGDGGAM